MSVTLHSPGRPPATDARACRLRTRRRTPWRTARAPSCLRVSCRSRRRTSRACLPSQHPGPCPPSTSLHEPWRDVATRVPEPPPGSRSCLPSPTPPGVGGRACGRLLLCLPCPCCDAAVLPRFVRVSLRCCHRPSANEEFNCVIEGGPACAQCPHNFARTPTLPRRRPLAPCSSQECGVRASGR